MAEHLLTSLVYSIYRTIYEPQRWSMILKECQHLLGGDGCDIAITQSMEKAGRIVSHAGNYDESYIKTYNDYYGRLNPWLQKSERYFVDDAVWTGQDLCPHEQLIRTRFYNEWLRPQNLHHRVCGVICNDRYTSIYLSVLRRRSRDAFERHELNILHKLTPHLRQVFELQRLLGPTLASRPESLFDTAHRLSRAVALVGPDNRVDDANAAGTRLIDDAKALAANGPLWARINGALRTAAGRSGEAGAQLDLTASDGSRLPVTVVPLPADAAPDRTEPAVVIVGREAPADPHAPGGGAAEESENARQKRTWRPLVIDGETPAAQTTAQDAAARDGRDAPARPGLSAGECRLVMRDSDDEARIGKLRAIYGFTRAEARLSMLLACGRNLQESAKALSVSITTVRTHLQRIFSKTETHHQGELVAMLIAGPARLPIECVPLESEYEDCV